MRPIASRSVMRDSASATLIRSRSMSPRLPTTKVWPLAATAVIPRPACVAGLRTPSGRIPRARAARWMATLERAEGFDAGHLRLAEQEGAAGAERRGRDRARAVERLGRAKDDSSTERRKNRARDVKRGDLRDGTVGERRVRRDGVHGNREKVPVARECGERGHDGRDDGSSKSEASPEPGKGCVDVGASPFVVCQTHEGSVVADPAGDGAQPSVDDAGSGDDGIAFVAGRRGGDEQAWIHGCRAGHDRCIDWHELALLDDDLLARA